MKHAQENRLEQVVFLKSLAPDIEKYKQEYLSKRLIVLEYKDLPPEMDENEWYRVSNALNAYYQPVKFFYRIALLTELSIIDKDLLYIFYYEEILGCLHQTFVENKHLADEKILDRLQPTDSTVREVSSVR